ncbi:MAG TPA: sigma 54-interacting transcriptional regulator [Pirellulales bacterium]|jgi:transcriptional regulator with GAF, ATPase, and Fis domain
MNAASLQAIATSVAQERDLKAVLQRMVAELAAQPRVALTRIWLLTPAYRSEAAPQFDAGEIADKSLRLAASAGTPRADENADWSRLDGPFQTVLLGAGKVGLIGATGESVLLEHAAGDRRWVVDQQWISDEAIQSFAGHPLIFRGKILGVLALFSRARLTQVDFDWLRAFADQAAVAIANARAFEEIERLQQRLQSENSYLREEIEQTHSFGQIIGSSDALAKVLEQIDLVAPTRASVLILGESGTGKELIARAIHQRSLRREHPLVKVNCAAVPRELFESEFFGHMKGSFTGALRDRVGRFQLADGGTLFLDEVGDIPLELQGKLLRVLQDGHIERVGADETRCVDVRVIAATNRNLQADVAAGRFRQDLYFRLSVFPIEILPLRERVDDIPLLARHFLERCCAQMRRSQLTLSTQSVAQLARYPWPGNVRELQNVIERAVISDRGGRLRFDTLLASTPPKPGNSGTTHRTKLGSSAVVTREQLLHLEKESIQDALTTTNGKIYGPRGAAELLGMRPTTLASRLKKLGIAKPR